LSSINKAETPRRGREAGRAAADDQHRNGDFVDRVQRGRSGDRREDGQAVHGIEFLARTDEFHARFHRKAVGQDETLGALAVGAKYSLRGMIFMMIAENTFPVGEEGGGDGFARSGLDRPALPGDGDGLGGGGRQDGMFFDAKIAHIWLLELPLGASSESDLSPELYHISDIRKAFVSPKAGLMLCSPFRYGHSRCSDRSPFSV
jgi:hypothetical protein